MFIALFWVRLFLHFLSHYECQLSITLIPVNVKSWNLSYIIFVWRGLTKARYNIADYGVVIFTEPYRSRLGVGFLFKDGKKT